jgi:hypothetical protein
MEAMMLSKANLYLLLLVVAAVALVLTVSCGGGSHGKALLAPIITEQPQDSQRPADTSGTPDEQAEEQTGGDTSETGAGSGGDEDEGGQDGYEYGELAWWENPYTGEAAYITEGYATIGLFYFPSWIAGPPADVHQMNEEYLRQPTVQALLERGFELVQPYGFIQAGEFKLPPDLTFAEAYAQLPEEYPDIAYVDPWSTGDALLSHDIVDLPMIW